MATLYAIEGDFQALDDLLTQLEGDIGDEESAEIYESMVAELIANLGKKADGYCFVIDDAKAHADAIKAEMDRLGDLRKTWQNKADRLKKALMDAMERTGQPKIEASFHKLSICKAGGKRALKINVPAESLPHCYQRHLIDVDTDAVRADLEAGKTVDGCYLAEQGRYLKIK